MSSREIKSDKGLFSLALADHPLNPLPDEAKKAIIDKLTNWKEVAIDLLKEKKLPCNLDGRLSSEYFKRCEQGVLDKYTFAYPLLYNSTRALRALAEEKEWGLVPYPETTEEAIDRGYLATYYMWQATKAASDMRLLSMEHSVMHGQKSLKDKENARSRSSSVRSSKARHNHNQWQEWANEVWNRDPSRKVKNVAEIIKKKYSIPQSVTTIRKKIKKVGRV